MERCCSIFARRYTSTSCGERGDRGVASISCSSFMTRYVAFCSFCGGSKHKVVLEIAVDAAHFAAYHTSDCSDAYGERIFPHMIHGAPREFVLPPLRRWG